MAFINRETERMSLKTYYEANMQKNKSQIYIIEANHGVGKSEFVREVSKYFSNYPLDIFQFDDNKELSAFKRMVLELDKASVGFCYDDFRTFYINKINNKKYIKLLLKITSIFGQALIKGNASDVDIASLIDNSSESEMFLLNAQTENLFDYCKYVFSTVHVHLVFHNAYMIDSGSLDLLSKLISLSEGCVFIFESANDDCSSRIEQYIKNSHSVFCEKIILNKLSDNHMQEFIQQLLCDLKLEADSIDSTALKESIEKGDLAEISSILKDFNERFKIDNSIKIRSTKEILQSLTDNQIVLLILIYFSDGKLNISELSDIVNELNGSYNNIDVDLLLDKNLVERNNNYIFLLPFVHQVLCENEYESTLKYAVASALVKNLNMKLNEKYNSRYVDILVEYYLCNKLFLQLKSLLTLINQRLKKFNTQAERIDYFKKFSVNREILYTFDNSYAVLFAKIAYDSNLYYEALEFINLANDAADDTIYIKSLLLNRCEYFSQSEKYIKSKLYKIDKRSSIYFKLSLVLMMNLIQLNERDEAEKIYHKIKTFNQEPLYPYMIRLSNVFHDDFQKRLEIVESITNSFYKTQDNEFSGLHAIYLAYLYSINKQPAQAERELLNARDYFGNELIYNHMILHNEATIKFHKHEINQDISCLLENAKITAYDKYDLFAINNNLLVYYMLCDEFSSFQCQSIAHELEEMLVQTDFKRFLDIIYYNLYYYYLVMFNYEKSEYYKNKLIQKNIKYDNSYKYKLMYETSWKLPLDVHLTN